MLEVVAFVDVVGDVERLFGDEVRDVFVAGFVFGILGGGAGGVRTVGVGVGTGGAIGRHDDGGEGGREGGEASSCR